MTVYFITGKLGGGKSLCAVGRIRDYLNKGSVVATNLNIEVEKLLPTSVKNSVIYRIPDKPSLTDLEAIGVGNSEYDESKNGLLVLDECGTWFNSRSWADKERQSVINWFLHARKLGWDILFIVQDISIVDKQARLALAEHVVYCRRMDRISIPFIGPLVKMITGVRLTLPQSHLAIVKYGDSQTSLTVDRWMYRGRGLYRAYDTKQIFSENYDSEVYQYLPPYHVKGRYQVLRDGAFFMRMTKIYLKRFSHVALLSAGLVLGLSTSVYVNSSQIEKMRKEIDSAQLEALQASQVKPVEADPVEYDDNGKEIKPLTFAQKYEDYSITGYMKTADRIYYQVSNGEHSETWDSLRQKGLIVRDRGSCEMLIVNPKDRTEFTSVYAKDCIPEVTTAVLEIPESLQSVSVTQQEPLRYDINGRAY
jgi:Zonular occludens toxin (Zot)